MSNFKIVEKLANIEIYTPYNGEFVTRVKKLGAKWDSSYKTWVTDASNIEYVRELMMEIYGESDINTPKYVDVELVFTKDYDVSTRCDFYRFGRPCLKSYGRDSSITIGDNVSLVSGNVKSTGSAKNWYIFIEADTKIVIRHLPESLIDKYRDSYKEHGIEITILADKMSCRKNLELERDKLLSRLNAINNELENL